MAFFIIKSLFSPWLNCDHANLSNTMLHALGSPSKCSWTPQAPCCNSCNLLCRCNAANVVISTQVPHVDSVNGWFRTEFPVRKWPFIDIPVKWRSIHEDRITVSYNQPTVFNQKNSLDGDWLTQHFWLIEISMDVSQFLIHHHQQLILWLDVTSNWYFPILPSVPATVATTGPSRAEERHRPGWLCGGNRRRFLWQVHQLWVTTRLGWLSHLGTGWFPLGTD